MTPSQIKGEIEKHKWIESEKAGYDLNKKAVIDWLFRYGKDIDDTVKFCRRDGWLYSKDFSEKIYHTGFVPPLPDDSLLEIQSEECPECRKKEAKQKEIYIPAFSF